MEVKCLPLGNYQTNCYIVWGNDSDQCIVIDPGYEPDSILEEATRLGKTVTAILLTHGHFDHVGGVRTLAHRTGCRIYVHREEMDLPEQMTGGFLFYSHNYGEGDILQLAGLTLQVLHTPGHSPGSVCLLAEDTIFCGDTLFQDSIGRTDFPGSDPAKMRHSLQRLVQLPGDYRVLPGHGSETTLSAERQYNPFLQ